MWYVGSIRRDDNGMAKVGEGLRGKVRTPRIWRWLWDNLAKDLHRRLGRGFGRRNLFLFREFYMRYPIVQSLIAQFGIDLPVLSSVSFTPLEWQEDTYFERLFCELPWTHFIELIRMDDPLKCAF